MIWCVDWRQDADLTDNNDEEEADYWYDDDYDNNDADEHKDITYITITMMRMVAIMAMIRGRAYTQNTNGTNTIGIRSVGICSGYHHHHHHHLPTSERLKAVIILINPHFWWLLLGGREGLTGACWVKPRKWLTIWSCATSRRRRWWTGLPRWQLSFSGDQSSILGMKVSADVTNWGTWMTTKRSWPPSLPRWTKTFSIPYVFDTFSKQQLLILCTDPPNHLPK